MSSTLRTYKKGIHLSSDVVSIQLQDHSVGMCGWNAVGTATGFKSGAEFVKFVHGELQKPLVVESNRRMVKDLFDLLEKDDLVLSKMIPQRLWLNLRIRK